MIKLKVVVLRGDGIKIFIESDDETSFLWIGGSLTKEEKKHMKICLFIFFFYLLGWTYKRFFSIQSVLDSNSSSNQ